MAEFVDGVVSTKDIHSTRSLWLKIQMLAFWTILTGLCDTYII